jgi:hypothetical protein
LGESTVERQKRKRYDWKAILKTKQESPCYFKTKSGGEKEFFQAGFFRKF